MPDLNWRPLAHKTNALPTELKELIQSLYKFTKFELTCHSNFKVLSL